MVDRFNITAAEQDPWVEADPSGQWVRYSDYAALEAKLAALSAENERLRTSAVRWSFEASEYAKKLDKALEREARLARPAEQVVTDAMELARAVLAQVMTAGFNTPGPTPADVEKAFWALDDALKAAMESRDDADR